MLAAAGPSHPRHPRVFLTARRIVVAVERVGDDRRA
jgi:hypothetical protein